MKYLRVKGYDKFQHYKDRRPPWIKLYVSLLDDYEFCCLPDGLKGQLMMVWLFASTCQNKIPHDAKWLRDKLSLSKIDIDGLIDSGFVETWAGQSDQEGAWASRYIPKEVRAQTFSRDHHKCVLCGTKDALEVDHIVPISKGGNSEIENLQILCRKCNRRKRSSLAEQDATQMRSELLQRNASLCSLETETETETETENPPVDSPPAKPTMAERVEKVWKEHLQARGQYHVWKNGKPVGRAPTLTSGIKRLIRSAIKEHGLERTIDAGKGIFFSEHHIGKNDRDREYLDPMLCWRLKPNDNVYRFSELVAEEREKQQQMGIQ